ncbi:homoserine kinase [Brevibacterium sp. UCMA 11752]|uniref:homoserine kinase n=1 Tax=Brevibacterium sp. UCMA 11752 TaxID=2745946 RepID=UPI001F1DF0ED|nr:homoserine kinase [Brevibacterium sp. UCMA 11752]MCF2588351.1 homoserine kinase [Brevibacterium sp. UCMA 11752]
MRIQIEVPATSANLGPGYDAFGLALGIFDTLTLTIHDEAVDPSACVSVTGESAETLPTDRSHLIMRVIVDVLHAEYPDAPADLGERLSLDCVNRIPHSRGLGSSAAAIVGAIALAGEIGAYAGGDKLSRQRVLELASELEGHPDNAAPAVFGGLTIALPDPARSWQVPSNTLAEVTVLVPEVRLDTEIARSVIPVSVEHEVAAENSARAALLIHGFVTDASVLLEATDDRLHQEFRREAYPESMVIVDGLRDEGLPAVISGAGPTVLVLASTVPPALLPPSVTLIHTAIDLGGYRVQAESQSPDSRDRR